MFIIFPQLSLELGIGRNQLKYGCLINKKKLGFTYIIILIVMEKMYINKFNIYGFHDDINR